MELSLREFSTVPESKSIKVLRDLLQLAKNNILKNFVVG